MGAGLVSPRSQLPGFSARYDVVFRVFPSGVVSVAGPGAVPSDQFLTLLVGQIGQQLFFPHDFFLPDQSTAGCQVTISVILMKFSVTRSLEANSIDK